MSKAPRDRNSPRAPARDSVDQSLDALADLWRRMDQNGPKGKPSSGMLEKFDYFCRVSDRGRDCTYAVQSKKLFLLNDFADVKALVEQVVKSIRKLPGHENFGR